MLAGHVKNAVMIILLIGVVVLGSYLLQLKVEELQTDKEPLEAKTRGPWRTIANSRSARVAASGTCIS
jgi:hypothetical protein